MNITIYKPDTTCDVYETDMQDVRLRLENDHGTLLVIESLLTMKAMEMTIAAYAPGEWRCAKVGRDDV